MSYSSKVVLVLWMLGHAQSLYAQGRWLVDRKPTLDIAGTLSNGDVIIGNPVGATRLSDGGIVVADGADAATRFFDASGRLVRVVGRKGDGPGEFQNPFWLGQCGQDSVFVWDLRSRRMTVIGATGQIVRQFNVSSQSRISGIPFTIACSRSGVLAFQALPVHRSPTAAGLPVVRGTGPVWLADASGSIRTKVADVASGESISIAGGGGPRPLGPQTTLAIATDRLYVGTGDSAFVEAFSLDGSRVPSLALRLPARPATAKSYERATETMAMSVPVSVREQYRQMMLAAPAPKEMPPYTALLTDAENVLWVVRSAPGELETQLRAVDRSGRVLSDVQIPLALAVYEIGRDYILGTYAAADGDQHVAMFRLSRSR